MTGADGNAPALPSRRRTLLLALGVAVAALLLWGGYGHHWSWTGINGRTATLWDWLKLTLLPLAFAVLPIWLRPDARLQHDVKVAALVAGLILAVIALGGYLVPWGWTGFRGNSLWDWLNLVALPLAVAVAPLWPEIRENWEPRHSTLVGVVAGAFLVVVLAGYLVPWAWTGFTGNTAWDWLHLLVLPLLVPAVLVPTIKPVAEVPMTPIERPAPSPRQEPANSQQAASPSVPAAEPQGPPPAG
jgi:putative effector of murein hydrolase LrgA (UPF0299 family)